MKIWSALPVDRFVAGTCWVTDDAGATIFGPVRARGEADNAGARDHGNPDEDPTEAYGDHPYGEYAVVSVEVKELARYGPYFLRLDPVSGQALEAKKNGRAGIGAHGGRLHADGRLRETFGCLRVDDDVDQVLGDMAKAELAAGRPVPYECVEAV